LDDAGVAQVKKKKAFFFEKKKQKTLALALCLPDAVLIQFTRPRKSKSFLVLFFKKEHFLPAEDVNQLHWPDIMLST
jgi:hypothetical protein